jgi:hypothetical protein
LQRDLTVQSRDNTPISAGKAQITSLPASPAAVLAVTNAAARLERAADRLASAAGVLNQRAEMPGLAVKLDQHRDERDRR